MYHIQSTVISPAPLLVILVLLTPIKLVTAQKHPRCGNSQFDHLLNATTNYQDGKKTQPPEGYRQYQDEPLTPEQIAERFAYLKSHNIPVRLAIFYDKSFYHGFDSNETEIEKYVKNLIFGLQLIYEQPKMFNLIKFNFVTVSLKLDQSVDVTDGNASRALENFQQYIEWNKPKPNSDLNILLVFRNLWDLAFDNKSLKVDINGQGFTAGFCYRKDKSLILNAKSLGESALILAHETAHAFSSFHDGALNKCDPTDSIMAAGSQPRQQKWSDCTPISISSFLIQDKVFSCAFDVVRLQSSKPYKPVFDLAKIPGNPNRLSLPGQAISIDDQCKRSLDQLSRSNLNRYGFNDSRNSSISICERLYCNVLNQLEVDVGPAAIGSRCSPPGQEPELVCWHLDCLRLSLNV